MDKKDLCKKIATWALILSNFDYTIEHRKGSCMRHVDALSRNPICMVIQDSLTLKITQAQGHNDYLKVINEVLKSHPFDKYSIKNDVLYKCVNGNDLLVVPDDMQISLIRNTYEKGHFAVKRTNEKLKRFTS